MFALYAQCTAPGLTEPLHIYTQVQLIYGWWTCCRYVATFLPTITTNQDGFRRPEDLCMASFVPRRVYDHLSSIPRSYFIGHHARALREMKGLLASIDLVIECRDYRTPLVSRNPLFEQNLGDRPRMIVYTKQDLGSNHKALDKQVCKCGYWR